MTLKQIEDECDQTSGVDQIVYAGSIGDPPATSTNSGEEPGPGSMAVDTTLDFLKLVHRHDGFVSFGSKHKDRGLSPRCAIKATTLENHWPAYRNFFIEDGFVSINASYRHASEDQTSDTGRPKHRSNTLRFLCACYCDVDCYRVKLSFEEAREKYESLVRLGSLPRASILVSSGRGMWLVWLLHDPVDTSSAHYGAFSDSMFSSLNVHREINRRLVSELAPIGADPQSVDGARYLRLPGSVRTDGRPIAQWWAQRENGVIPSYTLWELADRVGVPCRRMLPALRAEQPGKRNVPNRAKGQRAADRAQLLAIQTLLEARGGIAQGQRNTAAYIYATCLRYSRSERKDVVQMVRSMGLQCRPPLSGLECQHAVRSAFKSSQKRLKKTTIAERLSVTRREARLIVQSTGCPFPCSDGEVFGPVYLQPLSRAQRRERRQTELTRLIRVHGLKWSSRRLAAELSKAEHHVSHQTVLSDLRSLGVDGRQGRPDRESRRKPEPNS